MLIGKPRDLSDTSIFTRCRWRRFWPGSVWGPTGCRRPLRPAEAFTTLLHSEYGDHRYLAVFLALATAVTVFVISACYSHIIEEFPTGGGGYLVASKLLGPRVGVVSGCALLVDYALTITTSIAAAGDALFGLLGTDWSLRRAHRITSGSCWPSLRAIGVLIVLNLRGIKESVEILMPIFLVFLFTHVILIVGTLLLNIGAVGDETERDRQATSAQGLERPQSRPAGHAAVVLARLFARRRHVHRHRGRLEQHARDARAARGHRQAHHDLHGLLAGVHGRRLDGRLPAAGHPAAPPTRR